MSLRKHLTPGLLGSRLFFAGIAAVTLLASATACTQETDRDDDDDDSRPNSPANTGGACTEGEMMCANADQLNVCEEGTMYGYSCNEVCEYYGYESLGCGNGSCQCGQPTDDWCLDGVLGACFCFDYYDVGSCSDADIQNYYESCHQGTDDGFFSCSSAYVSGNQVDCSAIADHCS